MHTRHKSAEVHHFFITSATLQLRAGCLRLQSSLTGAATNRGCWSCQEGLLRHETHHPPWLSAGVYAQVDFRNVQMRYRDGLPLVLRGLSVTVSPGSRCGVVGRTGAGKSSLINCLFRLQELCGGSIVIDGIDIAKMGLKDLRTNMAIIPQVCMCPVCSPL